MSSNSKSAEHFEQQLFELAPVACLITSGDGTIQQANSVAAELFGCSPRALVGESITKFVSRNGRENIEQQLQTPPRPGAANAIEMPLRRNGPADLQTRATLTRIGHGGHATGTLLWLFQQASGPEEQKAQGGRELVTLAARRFHASLELDRIFEQIKRLVVPAFADLCLIHLRDSTGRLWRAAVAQREPALELELADMERRYLQFGGMDSALEQTRRAVRVTPELLGELAHGPEHLAALRRLELQSLISMPLLCHGRLIGGIAFGVSSGSRPFDGPAAQRAEELSRVAALALDNARLYEEAQEQIRARDHALHVSMQETRVPLSVISTSVQALERLLLETIPLESDLGTEQAGASAGLSHLRHIELAAHRLTYLTQSLVELIQLESGSQKYQPQRIHLGKQLEKAVAAYDVRRGHAGARHPIRLELVPGNIYCRADVNLIGRLLTHLLENAVKFSPPDGEIEVRLDMNEEQSGERPAAHLLVRDTGIGIPPEERAQIFQPFFRAWNTAARNYAGIGVGLAICQGIVRLHDGKIWAESDGPDRGSAFHVLLPRAELDEA